MDSSGSISVVAGTGSTSFSDTRGAAGGAPFIPVDSIELAQIKLTSETSAVISDDEIYQVPGVSIELAEYPFYEILYAGEAPSYTGAGIKFYTSLPLSHTGSTTKKAWCQYYDPIFAEIQEAYDFTPPRETASATSTTTYSGVTTVPTVAKGAGSFSAKHSGKSSDLVLQIHDSYRWIKFYPDKYSSEYQLFLAYCTVADSYPAEDAMAADVSIIGFTDIIYKS